MVQNLVRDVINTENQLGPTDTVIPILKLFSDQIKASIDSIQVVRQNIGDAFTVGHSTNSIVGAGNGVGGGQVTIGVGDLGSSSLHYST